MSLWRAQKGECLMLSFQKYFLFRRISKYIRKNLTAEPSHSAASFSRDFLDIMKLNEDIPEDEFCDEAPASAQISAGSPLHHPRPDAALSSPEYQQAAPAKAERGRHILSGPEKMDRIRSYVDSNYTRLGFSQRLQLYLRERDITTAMIYQRSFIDRKLISKILSSEDYHPSKQTVFALCIALRLNLEESREFLSLAGYTFSHHKKYDLIIEFLLDNQIYNIDAVNEILFHFTEPCFGE